MPSITFASRTVHPVHFEDYDGSNFERLVFAYHLRAGWSDLAWYGQTGSDQGRDIVAFERFDEERGRKTVIQCVNRSRLEVAKATRDMRNAAFVPTGVPDAFKFVCRGNVSAERRDKVSAAAHDLGIRYLEIWSGAEFEEHLRLRAETLLQRFMKGQIFPDAKAKLKVFVDELPGLTDDQAIAILATVFDRPAFWTPFYQECSLGAFEQAIEDTICALNTGIYRTRGAGNSSNPTRSRDQGRRSSREAWSSCATGRCRSPGFQGLHS
jgi:hypothetical protein